jgi:hypothetical protein
MLASGIDFELLIADQKIQTIPLSKIRKLLILKFRFIRMTIFGIVKKRVSDLAAF